MLQPVVFHEKTDDCGLSLVEVMISMAIIAIGLLGIVGLLSLAMNNDTASRLQSLAALEAYSLSTDIQANPAYWLNGAGASISETAPSDSAMPCVGVICTPAAIAQEDVANWGYTVQHSLPDATGSVNCTTQAQTETTPASTTCQVSIDWHINHMTNSLSNDMAGVTQNTYVLEVQP